MTLSISKATRAWGHGLLAGCIGGAATAGTSFLGVAGAAAVGVPVSSLDWRQLVAIVLAGGVSSALAYLRKCPLPDEEDAPAA